MNKLLYKVGQFYFEGFKSMTLGKKLWTIIIIKLIIIFIVLRIFFFPDFLKTKFRSDDQRTNHVIEQLTK